MATGSYDSNGIWKYGEDDNISLFSTTLNKLADSVSAAETADRARLATLEAGSLAGLIPVKPGTATFAGGTGAVNSLGTVSFTGCSSVYLDSLFSSAYNKYKIIIDFVKTGADSNDFLQFKLRAGGVSSDTNYDAGLSLISISSGAVAPAGGYNAAYGVLGRHYYAGQSGSVEFDILNPQAVKNATWFGRGNSASAAIPESAVVSGIHRNASAFDGIRLYMSANGMTGVINVYGYNN